ncbi:Retrovirus-related Pol polyprotein from transposon 17.6 [Labeo rohita]|uniref:ribonuclease H n=1 Tax=Labeo rohita TaxID=84645 RepID=A0ABQ8MHB4_LABRO|nr:Retrovirus-related Pol polyprotein from transposon 17.6 [Labeo rohita]
MFSKGSDCFLVSVHLDPHATPVVHSPRRIPLALRSRLKEELESMERQGVIVKVTEPTEWVNFMVVAEKLRTGHLRVCLDPRDLNKAIKRPHYPLPTLEDITSKLAAQDEFQRKIDETYEGLNGVMAIVDDILIYGKTKAEHDENLHVMLEWSRERGVKLYPEKSVICATEVSYFGHLLTADGVKSDPAKVAAVRVMEPPKEKVELETVLAFKKMKELLTCEPGPVLAYFEPLKELRLQVDASKYGLGAVLMQDGRPIAYSKSLSESEINYAQIEK